MPRSLKLYTATSFLLLLFLCFSTDSHAQRRGSFPGKPVLESSKDPDIDQIIGVCGCKNCGGRLEHNDLNNPEVEDGARFELLGRWSATTTSGGGLSQGDPTILTWSIVPDGTDTNDGPGFVPSNLIARLDTIFNEPNAGTADLTNRFWHGLMVQSFDRWSELAGLDYVYEPNDDGATNFAAGGQLGVRGDIRIGGFNIDGAAGPTLAFNDFPNVGDMAIDTSETAILGNSFANFRAFRNIIMHEHGHGMGVLHLESNNARFLMEPSIDLNFDGPQLDDIRAAHRFYGDILEKTNNRQGNNSVTNATDLGVLVDGVPTRIGLDGASGTVVTAAEDDFISVDDNGDVDFYRFELSEAAFVDINLTPVGATYNQSPQFQGGTVPLNSSSVSNLTLAIFDAGGSLVQTVNSGGLGEAEIVEGLFIDESQFFVRVTGTANNIQLYSLSVTPEYVGEAQVTGPTFINVAPGSLESGGIADLAESDDSRAVLFPAVPVEAGDDELAVALLYSVALNPASLEIRYEGSAASFNVEQTISLFNYDTGMFESIDTREVPLVEESTLITPDGLLDRFVEVPSGNVTMEVRYETIGPVLLYPWAIRLDQLAIEFRD